MDMYESEHVFFPLNINGKDEIFLLSTSVNNIKTYIEVQLSWFPLILTWVSYLSSSSSEGHDAEGEVLRPGSSSSAMFMYIPYPRGRG